MTRGVSRPALSAAALIDGITWLSSVAGPVHHVSVPSATAPASSSMRGASAASTTGIGDEPGTVDLAPGGQRLAFDGDRLTADQGHERAQVLAHVPRRLVERVAPHALDHDLVREPDPEHEPSAGCGVRRQRLTREHHRVPRVGGHHRGAELDVGHLAPDDGEERQRVMAEDLRHPVAGEPLVPCGPSGVDVPIDVARADVTREDPDAHLRTLRQRHQIGVSSRAPARWKACRERTSRRPRCRDRGRPRRGDDPRSGRS